VADASRINALSMIAYAGSGHIGSSFSAMDIVTWLWTEELKDVEPTAVGAGDRYFSSKGHDAPGLYALLIGLGWLEDAYLTKLRRLGGLPGHPDRSIPYTVTNTGSLGMGVSKARGLATADRMDGASGRIFVLTGDGELQEGQFWESLQPAANGAFSEITVIVDHNKIQSDTFVDRVSPLGDLEARFGSFGWAVERCDGHDPRAIEAGLGALARAGDRPRILIADTIKGRGVSFMEGSRTPEDGLYRFHSGAPSEAAYTAAVDELLGRTNAALAAVRVAPLDTRATARPHKVVPSSPQRLIDAYARELVTLGEEVPALVALDGDLMVDCGVLPFRDRFPDRFIECGIAEQDMVSMAGALALKGKVPVVHSFACFLSTRPNEQIFNNATDQAKVVYHASLAGLLPAGPGHSHQSVRDVSAVGSIPGLTMVQPGTEEETRRALRWAVLENTGSTWIRLTSVPYEVPYRWPDDHKLTRGQGLIVRDGADAAVIAYGPVMLSEALAAAELLESHSINIRVINLPWLNTVDHEWLRSAICDQEILFMVEDHSPRLGQSAFVMEALSRTGLSPRTHVFGVEGIPACGQNAEVLEHHGLDAARLAARIRERL
jgi:transketolase